ncbi:hypothetical protein Q5752_005346 [Cryptotrichosporon argae]
MSRSPQQPARSRDVVLHDSDYISRLPSELLTAITDLLPALDLSSLLRTNRTLEAKCRSNRYRIIDLREAGYIDSTGRDIAHEPRLQHYLDTLRDPAVGQQVQALQAWPLPDMDLEKLLERCPNVEYLSLTATTRGEDAQVQQLNAVAAALGEVSMARLELGARRGVRHLTVNGRVKRGDSLNRVLAQLPYLQSLTLALQETAGGVATSDAAPLSLPRQLLHLNLTLAPGGGIPAEVATLDNLRSLSITRHRQPLQDGADDPAESAEHTPGTAYNNLLRMPALTSLNLDVPGNVLGNLHAYHEATSRIETLTLSCSTREAKLRLPRLPHMRRFTLAFPQDFTVAAATPESSVRAMSRGLHEDLEVSRELRRVDFVSSGARPRNGKRPGLTVWSLAHAVDGTDVTHTLVGLDLYAQSGGTMVRSTLVHSRLKEDDPRLKGLADMLQGSWPEGARGTRVPEHSWSAVSRSLPAA